MGSFTNGLLVGLGLSLLFAPKTGEETRSLLAERIQYMRGIPPENEELKQSVQEMGQRVQSVQESAARAAQMGNTVQDYAHHTATQAASVQKDLGNVAQQAGTNVPPTTQGTNVQPTTQGTDSPTQPLRPPRPKP
jgi:gas vesicle protein